MAGDQHSWWRVGLRRRRRVRDSSSAPVARQSHAATEHPCAASCRTSSRPMPEPPPVTTASFPENDSTAATSRFQRRMMAVR